MLQDSVRNAAFQKAIFAAVKPGDVVVDLGTGTGLLAMWAAEAGAGRVYAIEETDVALAAEAVIKANGYADRISVIRTNSGELCLPQLADVLIAEVVGHFLFEEGIVEYIADVRERLAKQDARIIPASAQVLIAPVELPDGFEEMSYWDTWKSPDLSVIRKMAANSAYVETVTPESVLAEPALLFEIDFHRDGPGVRVADATFSIKRQARFGAIAGWFRLALGGGVELATGPGDPPTHWQQCLFPVENSVILNPGESLACRITLEPFGDGTRWRWEVSSQPGGFKETHEIQILLGSRLLYERF